jgi:tRNA(Ile)-lysidine synthase
MLQVRFRLGGERLRPAGGSQTRELKKLFQEHGVVPWMRARVPLLYSRGELVAVGDLWVAADAAARNGEPALSVRWDRHPPTR